MIPGKGVANPSYKQRTMHHAALLGFMATVTSAIVVIGDLETHGVIEQRRAEDMKASLSQVISPDSYSNEILKDTLRLNYQGVEKTIYRARSNNQVVAVAFQMTGNGYAGPIEIIMGVNANSELLGMRVLSHSETPGLGDKIEAKKSRWIFSFDNLSFTKLKPEQWKVKKDKGYFDQFTGATITPRAVVAAVKAGMDFFAAHRDEILEQKHLASADKQKTSSSAPQTAATDSAAVKESVR